MEVLNHSLWLMLSYQSLGFFFYALYLHFQHKSTSRLLFGFFLLSLGLASFLAHIHLFEHTTSFFILFPLVFCFALILVPLFYLHHKSLLIKNFKLKKKDLLHFLPLFLMLLGLAPFWVLIATNQPQYLNLVYGFLMKGIPGQQTWTIEILVKSIVSLQLITYTIKGIRLYKSFCRQIPAAYCKDINYFISGIKTFAGSFVIMMLLLIGHRFLHISGDNFGSTFFILSLLFLNIGLAYYGIRFEDNYLFECQNVSGTESIISPSKPIDKITSKEANHSNDGPKYHSSCICNDLKEELLAKLLHLMDEKQPYTNHKVRIDDIADMVGTNTKYLSQVINEHFGKNFHTFLNDYRCSKVIQLFNDALYDNYSIEGIAETCGFNSRSTFVASFKKYSGKLPSVYRSSIHSKSMQ